MESRCTDDTGYTQPPLGELIDVRGVNSSYHNNAIQAWKVAADGKSRMATARSARARRRRRCVVTFACVITRSREACRASPVARVRRRARADAGALKQMTSSHARRPGACPSSGTAAQGKDVYASRCEVCHGPTGQRRSAGGARRRQGHAATLQPQKTVGSYWPYATTLWDYVNRAMPFDHPSTLTPDEDLLRHRLRPLPQRHRRRAAIVMIETSLPKIQMPNRDGFVADPRPDMHKNVAQVFRPAGSAGL